MSDELKPCKHCGGEAKFQIFDTTCNVECQQCGIGTRNELLDNYQVCVYKWNRSADDNLNADVTNLKSDEISLTPDMDERGADSREKLEADLEDMVRSWCADDTGVKATRGAIMYWRVKELLDRQSAITRREFDGECEFCQSEVARLQQRVDSLTADAKRWADAANGQRLVAMEQADKVQELTAERDELKHANSLLQSTIAELSLKVDEKQAELLEARASCKADPVGIQLALARFADEWTTTDTRAQEQRCIVYHAQHSDLCFSCDGKEGA